MEDLTEVINDSLDDATTDLNAPETTESASEGVESPEPVEAAPEASNEPTELVQETAEVSSPAKSEQEAKVQDDFEKKYGIPAQSLSGRENRIPYSRVKKISEKADKDGYTRAKTEFSPKIQEYEKRIKEEFEPKLRDYETRLTQVAQFEQLMVNDPVGFLDRLAGLPQYAQVFRQLFAQGQGQPAQPEQSQPQPNVNDPMPEPDQSLSDGSKVYSMEGLQKLLDWQERRAEEKAYNRTIKAVEAKYGPLADSYNAYQRQQAALPAVNKQIAEARTWPLFNESEADIVKALEQNPSWGLERAYQSVVLPKFQSEVKAKEEAGKVSRDQIRAEVLKELKQAPRATSVSTGASRPRSVSSGTPRSLEDVINDSLKEAGLK